MSIAQTILEHPALPAAMARLLNEQRCAFLFGNTAADVQVVSEQPRQETHFFEMPLRQDAPLPWMQMLAAHPQLASPGRLPASQAAFLSGYLCHLQADWLWITDIFVPVFGPRCTWGTFSHRLYLHNVLRTYLDHQVLRELLPDTQACLANVAPEHWLPFVADGALRSWRDLLSPQLLPGAPVQTVEVFAARQGISTQQYYALLASQERMQEEIFSILPLPVIEAYRQRLVQENLQLLAEYLADRLLLPARRSWKATQPAQGRAWNVTLETNNYEID